MSVENNKPLYECDVTFMFDAERGCAGLTPLFPFRVKPSRVRWMRPGLRKYSCELALDTNTHRKIKLSDNNRKATRMREDQSYPDHPDRFDFQCPQLLCRDGLTGRCYWEVEWRGGVEISVIYRGIGRRGDNTAFVFGGNDQSWSLSCSDDVGYSVWHNDRRTSSSSDRVAVYVDCPAGTLSFYRVSTDTLIHLFTEPLYPGLGFWSYVSSPSLCSLSEGESLPARETFTADQMVQSVLDLAQLMLVSTNLM
ncbi:neoverrucotoxin subunit alpha-like isoform X1 [Micropterus salmoides]|uniref:neoverrucotoxin subunit alpha-like isoform X1 n=1 Tax=Micropterus salmoides TaxID=27706 RepID=UPI0018EDDA85|nr:neoverrucotoxin subunit alpha-like isoform X1 [Micropterus salmoides]